MTERISLSDRLVVTPTELAKMVGVGFNQVQIWLLDETFPAFREQDKKYVTIRIPVKAAERWLTQRAERRENMPKPLRRFKETGS